MTRPSIVALAGQLFKAQVEEALDYIDGRAVTAFGTSQGDYTLTATTSAQKLFNWSTDGAVTLGLGRYRYEIWFVIENMSATSGNGAFVLGGTATINGARGVVMGGDTSTPLTTVGTVTGQFFSGTTTAASMVTATTGTGIGVTIRGTFNVAAEGTFIPQIALVTAAAADVKAGAYCIIQKVADTGEVTVGGWS